MDSLTQSINSLLQILIQFGGLVVKGISAAELFLRAQLTQFGVTPMLQNILLLGLAALMIVGAVRLFGGLIRIAVILVVVLIALRVVTEALHT